MSFYAKMIKALGTLAARLVRDRKGSTLVQFSLLVLPLLALAGAALDYTMAARARAQLSAAADAAALSAVKAAVAYLNANGVSSGSIEQATTLAKQAAAAFFASDTAPMSFASTPQLNISLDVKAPNVTATLTATSSTATSILPLVGVNNLSIGAASAAGASLQLYYQVIFVVDVSGSMAIGGTAQDIAALQSNPQIKCAFACHDPNHFSSNTDFRAVAKSASITLKIDYVNQAIQSFVNALQTASNSAPGFYSVGINTFGSQFTVVQQVTSNMTLVKNAAAAIDVESISGPWTPQTDWGFTYTTNGLQATLQGLRNVGDGSSASKKLTFVIFLSDGVEDVPGATQWYRTTDLTYTSACTQLKNAGVTLISIAAPYPQITNDKTEQQQYDTLIAPISAQLGPTMQSCASSPSWYFLANDGPAITAAVNQAFASIMKEVRLTQ